MTFDDPAGIPAETFQKRRRLTLERIGEGVMVLPERGGGHGAGPYVADRELYYLTGLTIPGCIAVFVGGSEPRFVVFVPERDGETELWDGARPGPEEVGERIDGATCHPRSALAATLPELMAEGDRIVYRLGQGDDVERLVLSALARARARGARTGSGPRSVVDPGEVVDDLRVVKDVHELDAIRRACAITVEGHRTGVGAVAPGVGEWVVEAMIDGSFRSAGASRPGFETIVGGGANACVLHYTRNSDPLPEDGLVLIDAGAEVGLYNGDVTRTYPVSGRFTPPQRAVYDIVEAAHAAAIEGVRPGVSVASIHDAAVRVIVRGLVELGVLDGDADGLVEQGAHKPYFPHQTSHWLGLDVHDPGDYARNGTSRILEPGMVFTVEPGLYFGRGAREGHAAAYGGIGVRIEDDVLVTENGHEVLTEALPARIPDVEALVGR